MAYFDCRFGIHSPPDSDGFHSIAEICPLFNGFSARITPGVQPFHLQNRLDFFSPPCHIAPECPDKPFTNRMDMKHLCLAVFIFFTALHAYADETPDGEKDLSIPDGLYVQLGGGTEPDAIGGEVGYFGYQTENLCYVAGIGFLASERFDDLFVGANLGFRLSAGHTVSPFVGMGVFAGYSKKFVGAEDDNVDNDEDGDVDEEGEEKEVVDHVIASIFPEVGLHVQIAPDSRMTLSGRYHMTTEGRENDFWVYSLGFTFLFR
jgi:hypothetical protein